jgi:hypothetical protein
MSELLYDEEDEDMYTAALESDIVALKAKIEELTKEKACRACGQYVVNEKCGHNAYWRTVYD